MVLIWYFVIIIFKIILEFFCIFVIFEMNYGCCCISIVIVFNGNYLKLYVSDNINKMGKEICFFFYVFLNS